MEREGSVSWLRSLQNPRWDNQKEYGQYGIITADFFLTNWMQHDYLNIRQITRLKYQFLEQHTGHNLKYAGNW